MVVESPTLLHSSRRPWKQAAATPFQLFGVRSRLLGGFAARLGALAYPRVSKGAQDHVDILLERFVLELAHEVGAEECLGRGDPNPVVVAAHDLEAAWLHPELGPADDQRVSSVAIVAGVSDLADRRHHGAIEYQLPYTPASQKLAHVVLFGKPVTVMRT
jgi:hypothetical protein